MTETEDRLGALENRSSGAPEVEDVMSRPKRTNLRERCFRKGNWVAEGPWFMRYPAFFESMTTSALFHLVMCAEEKMVCHIESGRMSKGSSTVMDSIGRSRVYENSLSKALGL